MPQYSHDGVEVRFPDEAAGLSVSGLLSNKGMFHVKASPGSRGELFAFNSQSYHLSLVVEADHVKFRRNQYVARKTIGTVKRHFQILVSWNPSVIQLALMVDDNVGGDDACVTVPTNPIFVSPKLLTWARRFQLLPRSTYASPAEFLGVLVEALRQTERVIHDTDCYALFWDRRRATPGGRHPKHEPEVMAGIAGLLQDQALLGGFELLQESQAGPGSVDLRAIAALTDGGTTSVCVEGKNAHSQDLEHGVSQQLPAYMTSVRADYGIYLVLWYQCDQFPEPRESDVDLTWNLTKRRPLESIVIEKMNLALPISPSDRRFKIGS